MYIFNLFGNKSSPLDLSIKLFVLALWNNAQKCLDQIQHDLTVLSKTMTNPAGKKTAVVNSWLGLVTKTFWGTFIFNQHRINFNLVKFL